VYSEHVGFYSKNKFEKSIHLVGFIIRMSTNSINKPTNARSKIQQHTNHEIQLMVNVNSYMYRHQSAIFREFRYQSWYLPWTVFYDLCYYCILWFVLILYSVICVIIVFYDLCYYCILLFVLLLYFMICVNIVFYDLYFIICVLIVFYDLCYHCILWFVLLYFTICVIILFYDLFYYCIL